MGRMKANELARELRDMPRPKPPVQLPGKPRKAKSPIRPRCAECGAVANAGPTCEACGLAYDGTTFVEDA